MINLAPAGQKDSIEMRKVYADFIAQQSKNVSSVIALEADLMSSMAMDSVAQDIQITSLIAALWKPMLSAQLQGCP